jgi:hypothetical protein
MTLKHITGIGVACAAAGGLLGVATNVLWAVRWDVRTNITSEKSAEIQEAGGIASAVMSGFWGALVGTGLYLFGRSAKSLVVADQVRYGRTFHTMLDGQQVELREVLVDGASDVPALPAVEPVKVVVDGGKVPVNPVHGAGLEAWNEGVVDL